MGVNKESGWTEQNIPIPQNTPQPLFAGGAFHISTETTYHATTVTLLPAQPILLSVTNLAIDDIHSWQ